MREILFRGKSKVDDSGWKYGDLLHSHNGVCFIRYAKPFFGRKEYTHCEVDPATVGQYTGATDKNGAKIFEGDIVKAYWGMNQEVVLCTVEYEEDSASFTLDPILYEDWGKILDFDGCEVIGNIYDNPELRGVNI